MTGQSLPLEGVKILDLTTVVMGPFATQVLGDFGAEIIKIEEPGGDITRVIGPARNSGMASLYMGSNRNKKSLVLNLKKEEAKKALWKLIEEADIFIHNIEGTNNVILELKATAKGIQEQEIIQLKKYPK